MGQTILDQVIDGARKSDFWLTKPGTYQTEKNWLSVYGGLMIV